MWCSSRQHGFPYLWSTRIGSANSREVKLLFLDVVNEFNPGDGESGMSEVLKKPAWTSLSD
jgi:hypothetical protein